ncbi:MAG: NADH-quinone oxidoreductase subunit A [Armatimonadetes bacterium]|nr:NADH-quinone oxidoreductase subunit A [Armatimonadota bacterium]
MLAKDFLTVGIFLIVGIAFVVLTLLASWVFRPHRPSPDKLSTYECGEVPIGPAWTQFRVGYYIYALIFLIFDVEAVFVYPWAAELMRFSKTRALGILGLVDMVIFTAVLIVGLVWAWKKGVLEWK